MTGVNKMRDEDLILQIKKLQEIKPDNSWKQANRELLYSQISSGEQNRAEEKDLQLSFSLQALMGGMRHAFQPMMAVFLLIFIMFGGGMLSLQAARDTTPGDSLYIAKIINEKTQLALTFNEKKKMRLGLTFASNRAKELSQVLEEAETAEKQEKVKQLVNDFKKEINTAKSRLEKLQTVAKIETTNNNIIKEDPIVEQAELVEIEQNETIELAQETNAEEEMPVFSANVGKEERGMQTTDQVDEPTVDEASKPIQNNESDTNSANEEKPAQTSEELSTSTADFGIDIEKDENTDPQEIIKIVEAEVSKLLDQDDFGHMELSKLEEAIDKVEAGKVKGTSDTASSSLQTDVAPANNMETEVDPSTEEPASSTAEVE